MLLLIQLPTLAATSSAAGVLQTHQQTTFPASSSKTRHATSRVGTAHLRHADAPVAQEELPVGLVGPDADVHGGSATLPQHRLVCSGHSVKQELQQWEQQQSDADVRHGSAALAQH
eukprot:GHRQ01031500.1.p1 GENE.GHRQ01031500.1~~GHRQ01031500.1.p1  ORF type:complete len:116 (+),score=21.59 GHRQ01031500.1:569-916(+)